MVMAYNTNPLSGLASAFQTGMGIGSAFRQRQAEDAEREAVGKLLSGDESGWSDWGKVNPQAAISAWNSKNALEQKGQALENAVERAIQLDQYRKDQIALAREKLAQQDAYNKAKLEQFGQLNPYQKEMLEIQRKKLEQSKNGDLWNTDDANLWRLAHDEELPAEDRALARRILENKARIPTINLEWANAGRRGTLQADIDMGAEAAAEKMRGQKEQELIYNPQIRKAEKMSELEANLGLGGQVEKEKKIAEGEAKTELGNQAVQSQLPRLNEAAKAVLQNESEEGLGPVLGLLTPLGLSSEEAQRNYENIDDLNRAMTGMIRQKLSAMGVTGREMDTEKEAARNLYLLKPTDPRGIREQKVYNFYKNFLQMDLPETEDLISKYGLEE